MGILPAPEGNYVTYKILTNLRAELSFSEEDHKETNLRTEGVGNEAKIFWNKNIDKEIEVGDVAINIIKESLKKLDEAGKVNDQNAPLYERFMLE